MILEARDLVKRFGDRAILRGASLELRPGEVVLLRGANGSGKTTFARILSTALGFDAGTLTLDGEPIRRKLGPARRGIGFLSHRPLLYLGLTALENLEFFGGLSGVREPRHRARALLDRFGLADSAGTPVERYSRGMLQRVALIRALLPEPRVLILDEPYAGLDDAGADTLNQILGEARGRGCATLLVSHERERATPGVTRSSILRNGIVEALP